MWCGHLQAQRQSAPVTSGRASIEGTTTGTTASQQAAASGFLASRANAQAAPTVVDMRNSRLQATLLAPPNANGKAKIEDPNAIEATFTGSGQLVSGGRKLSQSGRVSINAPVVRAHTLPFMNWRVV